MDNVQDRNREFEIQSRNCIYFQTNTLRKGMNSVILLALSWIVPLLFFYKVGFSIK